MDNFEKNSRIVRVSVHSLKTHEPESTPIFFTWTRGKHNGKSSILSVNSNGLVIFEQQFCFQCAHHADGEGKIKFLDFVFHRGQDQNQEDELGSISINLRPYMMESVSKQSFSFSSDGGECSLVISFSSLRKRMKSFTAQEGQAGCIHIARRIVTYTNETRSLSKLNKAPSNDRIPGMRRSSITNVVHPNFKSVIQRRMSRPDSIMDKVQKVKTAIQAILDIPVWPATHVYDFHGIDVVLFATLATYDAFDVSLMGHAGSTSLNQFLNSAFQSSPLLASLGPGVSFFPLYGLVALLYQPPAILQINIEKSSQMADDLINLICYSLQTYLNGMISKLEDKITQVFTNGFDVDTVSKDISSQFNSFTTDGSIPKNMVSVIQKALVNKIDIELTNRLMGQPNTIFDTIHANQWNTFCGKLSDNGIDIVRFHESTSVILMTSVIDEDASKISRMCPHLTAITVKAILEKRQIDEDLKTKPNIEKFAQYYSLNVDEPFKHMALSLSMLIANESKSIYTTKWLKTPIPTQILSDFPYLREYFSV